jgi:hypothetical protein
MYENRLKYEENSPASMYSKLVLSEFFKNLISLFNAKGSLFVCMDKFKNFDLPSDINFFEIFNTPSINETSRSVYDLVIFDLPINLRLTQYTDDKNKFRRNHEFIIVKKIIHSLSADGLAFLTVSSKGLEKSTTGSQLIYDLKQRNIHLIGYIELPNRYLNLSFRPLIAIFSRKKSEELFLASVDNELDEILISNALYERNEEVWFEKGLTAKYKDFNGVMAEQIRIQKDNLLQSYKGFQFKRLGDFVISTKAVRSGIPKEISANSLAVKRKILETGEHAFCEHKNIFEQAFKGVILNLNGGIIPKYVEIFLNSALGLNCLLAAAAGTPNSTINAKILFDLEIPVPEKNIQKNLVETHCNLAKLRDQFQKIERDLVLNPKNLDAISNNVENLIGVMGQVTIADEIRARVRSGENKTTEFKETLSVDLKTGKKEKFIETSVLKTIVGFLNTEGGILIVGVSDNGKISGLGNELQDFYQGQADKFLLHFKNLIKTNIGEKFYPKLDWSLERVDGLKVLLVKVAKGAEPSFLGDDFYVRTNPATDKLQGEKLYSYLSQRF